MQKRLLQMGVHNVRNKLLSDCQSISDGKPAVAEDPKADVAENGIDVHEEVNHILEGTSDDFIKDTCSVQPKLFTCLADFSRVTCQTTETSSGDILTDEISEHNGADCKKEPPLLFDKVRAILVDPSCSGSGMSNNQMALLAAGKGSDWGLLDSKSKSKKKNTPMPSILRPSSHACVPHQGWIYDRPKWLKNRLAKLSFLQELLLLNALRNFPSVQYVVYSTCSIYEEENEGVVFRVANAVYDTFELVPIWDSYWLHNMALSDIMTGDLQNDSTKRCCHGALSTFCPFKPRKEWNRRGLIHVSDILPYEQRVIATRPSLAPSSIENNEQSADHSKIDPNYVAQCCLRSDPFDDMTNGFFVAMFRRRNLSRSISSKTMEASVNKKDQLIDVGECDIPPRQMKNDESESQVVPFEIYRKHENNKCTKLAKHLRLSKQDDIDCDRPITNFSASIGDREIMKVNHADLLGKNVHENKKSKKSNLKREPMPIDDVNVLQNEACIIEKKKRKLVVKQEDMFVQVIE